MSSNLQTSLHVLTSWKEIAAHMNKGVRTVQRWERELGLPVKRPSVNGHIVIAIPAELDEWITRLKGPSSTLCCSCKEELERTRLVVSELRNEVLRLQTELGKLSVTTLLFPAASKTLDGAAYVQGTRERNKRAG